MSDVILKVEDLSKQYRLGTIGTGTISHDLNRWWYRIRGKEDPYLKIGETNNRDRIGESPYVWALKDVSFDVRKGEIIGIIGKNGAGKSTLLKILSRVTSPTKGTIKSKGRIASLLEVGTGFHPEMTGRENIFLNGAILGMSRIEIKSKLDEIISFSGCERYIDTPVKRYSSGMTVRLAFAVAAHLEPDILVVDEVLAVGDAEFQRKAIGRMQDISKTEGRTVLLVSHNMATIRQLSTRGILLENGKIVFKGSIKEVYNRYVDKQRDWNLNPPNVEMILKKKGFVFVGVEIRDNNHQTTIIHSGSSVSFILKFQTSRDFDNLIFKIEVKTTNGETLFICNTRFVEKEFSINTGSGAISCLIESFPLNLGTYLLDIYAVYSDRVVDCVTNACKFTVSQGMFYYNNKLPKKDSIFLVPYSWHR